MKHFCVKDRKRYKKEQLNRICPGYKFKKCHLWGDYNEEELPENIVNSNILNLLDFKNIMGKEL